MRPIFPISAIRDGEFLRFRTIRLPARELRERSERPPGSTLVVLETSQERHFLSFQSIFGENRERERRSEVHATDPLQSSRSSPSSRLNSWRELWRIPFHQLSELGLGHCEVVTRVASPRFKSKRSDQPTRAPR